MDDSGFFTLLAHRAGSQQRENQLSATFAACFNYSPFFRRVALDVVRKACRIKHPLPKPDQWTSVTEVAPPKDGGGRVDISLRPPSHQVGTCLSFWLENKVEAPLTEKQVKKYRKHGCDFLVAVTKNRPDVSASKLGQLGAYAVRWQDFHRALSNVNGAKGSERFLIESFVEYLEELSMAHRQRISARDLTRLRAVLAALRGRGTYVTVREAFETADALVALLDDLRERLVETYPKLAALRRWGPKCGVWTEPGHGFDWFGWDLRRGHWREWAFDYGVYFPHQRREGIYFQAYIEGTKAQEHEAWWSLKDVSTRGVLNEEKLFSLLKRSVRRWGMV